MLTTTSNKFNRSPRAQSRMPVYKPGLNKAVKVIDPQLLNLKKGIWLYFLLLIFEGALRKWVLPGLSTPLLIIRDPLALWIVYSAWQQKRLPSSDLMSGAIAIGLMGILTSMLVGHGNIIVTIYGARSLLFHFPLIFIIGEVFTREDLIKMIKAVLWIAIPMVILTMAQFYSPQSAWVNQGVGGTEGGAGFSGAQGFLRPPGTFSFTNGNTTFFSLVAALIFYFWMNPKGINKFLLLGATFALLLSIPLSISRALFFQTIVSLIFTVLAASRKPKYIGKIVGVTFGLGIILMILSQTETFQIATGAFLQRFDTANRVEGGLEGVLIDRYLGGMVGALSRTGSQPLFGFGLGMGTSVGSMLLSGQIVFMIAEGEWGREIGELGPVLGLALVFIRIALGGKLALESYQKLANGDILPWLLLSLALTQVTQGGWGQPTSLGFSVLMGGLTLAAINTSPGKRVR